jgi:hypothetical protein
MNQHDLILLGEAKSALTQCTHILGARLTNEILQLIDDATKAEP